MERTEKVYYYMGVPCRLLATLDTGESVVSVSGEGQSGGSYDEPPEYFQTRQTLIVPSDMLSETQSFFSKAEEQAKERYEKSVEYHNNEIHKLRKEHAEISSTVSRLKADALKHSANIQGIQDFLDLATENFTHVIISGWSMLEIVEAKDFVKKTYDGRAEIRGMRFTQDRKNQFTCIVAQDDENRSLTPCQSYEDAITKVAKMLEESTDASRHLRSYERYVNQLPNKIQKYENQIVKAKAEEVKRAVAKKEELKKQIELAEKMILVLGGNHE
jgi:hypothetical protein